MKMFINREVEEEEAGGNLKIKKTHIIILDDWYEPIHQMFNSIRLSSLIVCEWKREYVQA